MAAPRLGQWAYDVLAVLCHQDRDRSLLWEGTRLGICARCTGLYAGLAFAGIAGVALRRRRAWYRLAGASFAGPLAFGVEQLGLDVGNAGRCAIGFGLGAWLGFAVGWLLGVAGPSRARKRVPEGREHEPARPDEATVQQRRPRFQSVDAVRGAALLAMLVVHVFVFGAMFGVTGIPIEHIPMPLRWSIRTIFFFLVGVSLALAYPGRVVPRKFLRRTGLLIACAAAVTITSLMLFPARPVYFGILHSIAACCVLALPFLRYTAANVALGALVIAAGVFVRHPAFNGPLLYWSGLGTWYPASLDLQPVLPWFGVVLLGIAAGRVLRRRATPRPSERPSVVALAFLGRHSLVLYMIHVPLLLGLMALLTDARR